jgi:hypothetical protein
MQFFFLTVSLQKKLLVKPEKSKKMETAKKLLIVMSLIFLFGFNTNTFSIDHSKDKLFRGFMIDAPRGVETIDYYFRLIDFCHEEELNSIIFRLTDDQGSAYLFTSHPELNMCKGAFTARELKKIVEYAQSRGIEMIPEIESFGHSRYITQTKKFMFLNDGPAGEDFNALCPVNEASLNLLKDLYTEVASIFPGQYFHIGCDEVSWGASELSKNALNNKSKYQIWAEYINKLNGCIKSLGKQTIIWGDVPIYKEKEILDLLDKDIVLMDWNYWESDKEKIESVANEILNKGFKLIGCPAVSWCEWCPRVGELQFKNLNAYAEVYNNMNNPGNLGIILSNWAPMRYLQNSQWDTYFIAAEIIKNNGAYNYMDAIPAFVKKQFGTKYNENWEKIYKTTYKETPQWECGPNDSLKFFPWSSEKQIKDIILNNKHLQNPFNEIVSLLSACKDSVNKNMSDFNDFRLTIEFIEYNYNRQNELLTFVNSKKTDLKSVKFYLKKVASEDQIQLSEIDSAWNLGRRGKPEKTDDGYMWSFYNASNYSKHLSKNPAEFMKILNNTIVAR